MTKRFDSSPWPWPMLKLWPSKLLMLALTNTEALLLPASLAR
mgnify:CR=1 FL=1